VGDHVSDQRSNHRPFCFQPRQRLIQHDSSWPLPPLLRSWLSGLHPTAHNYREEVAAMQPDVIFVLLGGLV
jgi:hypothetical protein